METREEKTNQMIYARGRRDQAEICLDLIKNIEFYGLEEVKGMVKEDAEEYAEKADRLSRELFL